MFVVILVLVMFGYCDCGVDVGCFVVIEDYGLLFGVGYGRVYVSERVEYCLVL